MPERWEPDDQLIVAVLNSPHTMSDLSHPDRCWVVAGLTRLGHTAEAIAERLSCSLRLIRTIRADDMTQVCLYAQRETDHFRNELRLARSEHKASLAAVASLTDELTRLRDHRNRLINKRTGVCHRGHPMTPYNTYEHRGRQWCRECHRLRQAAYRSRAATP